MFIGSWSQEAFEAFSRTQGMDVGQTWRSLRSSSINRSTQAARVAASVDLPEKPSQVRSQWRRGDQDCHAAPHQGRR